MVDSGWIQAESVLIMVEGIWCVECTVCNFTIDTRENKETNNPNAANLNICTAITFNNFEVTARETKMSTCQVKTCKNDHRKKEFRNVHFYRFPKEKALMLKWKEACGKENVDVKNGIFV